MQLGVEIRHTRMLCLFFRFPNDADRFVFTARCYAERGCATVSRLSVVCPSVTLRYDFHISWNTSKIISRPNSLRPMRLVTPTRSIWCNGNTPKLGETRGGVGKSGVLEHKSGNISETRKDRGKVTMESL